MVWRAENQESDKKKSLEAKVIKEGLHDLSDGNQNRLTSRTFPRGVIIPAMGST